MLFLALVALGLLRWQAPLIAVSALGLPLLFLFYLHESDMDDDLPLSSLVLTALLGIPLGVGWALLTGDIVAGSYDVALGDEAERDQQLAQLFAASLLKAQRALERRLIELAALDQDFAKQFSGGRIHEDRFDSRRKIGRG